MITFSNSLIFFSCIESWLKKSKSCPLCKAKNRSADIRFLYNIKISAHDNTELDFTLNQLKKEQRERAKIELERSKIVLDFKVLKDKYEALKRDYRDLQT